MCEEAAQDVLDAYAYLGPVLLYSCSGVRD